MHEPNPELHYVIGFSGGKDSVATWLHLTRELRLPHVTCTFADTGHESPIVHEYLDLLARDHGLPLVKIQPILEDFRGELVPEKIRERLGLTCGEKELWQQPLDMEKLAGLKRRFPGTMVRFCTDHLKLRPQRRWLHENCDLEKTVRVSGVRAEESESRAKHAMFSFDDFMGCNLWLPIHQWTHDDVFECHRRHGVPPNPLYLHGMGRVGCFPCIMARKPELIQIAVRFPEAFTRLREMEQRVAVLAGKEEMSFFANTKTPERFHSHTCPKTGKTFPDAMDVLRWALEDHESVTGQKLLFEEDASEDGHACTSKYGLCE